MKHKAKKIEGSSETTVVKYRPSDGIRRQSNPTEENDFMTTENTDAPLKKNASAAKSNDSRVSSVNMSRTI